MPAEFKITGVPETMQKLRSFPSLLRSRLRAAFKVQGVGLLSQARAAFYAIGLRRRSGSLIASLHYSAWAGKETAGVEVASTEDVFYSGWIEHGLAPRPLHERAKSRRGRINPMLGRAYEGHKAWGIKARPFLQNALEDRLSSLEDAALAAVDQAVADFNSGAA